MNLVNLSLYGFMTSMAFTLFIVMGSDEEGVIYQEGISKWNLIPFTYVIDLATWSSMDCQEKSDHMIEQGMSLKTRILNEETNYEASAINPISFSLKKCLENEN